MKKIIYLFAAVSIFASCGENKVETTTTVPASTESPIVSDTKPVYAYPVRYSQWEIGNPDHIKTVIDFYYFWDNKQADKLTSLFADTVRLRIPTEREEIVVPNSLVGEKLEKNRSMYASTSNNIISAVSLHDKESNEDWVMITTYNKWEEKSGKRDSVLYADNWRLKDGKINFLMSFYKLPTEQFVKKNDPAK